MSFFLYLQPSWLRVSLGLEGEAEEERESLWDVESHEPVCSPKAAARQPFDLNNDPERKNSQNCQAASEETEVDFGPPAGARGSLEGVEDLLGRWKEEERLVEGVLRVHIECKQRAVGVSGQRVSLRSP
jgi:hypothetical protein